MKARGLDVIIGLDTSSDDPNLRWPKSVLMFFQMASLLTSFCCSGSSLVFSQQRMTNLLSSSHQAFPPIPANTSEFISTGTNQRITFFGCNPTQNPPEYPLLIYLPNMPPANGDDPVTKYVYFFLPSLHY